MGACCATDSDNKMELRTINDSGLLLIEFGDSSAHWSDIYPQADIYDGIKADPSIKLASIDTKNKGGV